MKINFAQLLSNLKTVNFKQLLVKARTNWRYFLCGLLVVVALFIYPLLQASLDRAVAAPTSLPYGFEAIDNSQGNWGLISHNLLVYQLGNTGDPFAPFEIGVGGVPVKVFAKGLELKSPVTLQLASTSDCQGVKEIYFLSTYYTPEDVTPRPGDLLTFDVGDIATTSVTLAPSAGTDTNGNPFYWELARVKISASSDEMKINSITVKPASESFVPVLWAVTVHYDCPPEILYGFQSASPAQNMSDASYLTPLLQTANIEGAIPGQWRVVYYTDSMGNSQKVPFQITAFDTTDVVQIPKGKVIYILLAWATGTDSPAVVGYASTLTQIGSSDGRALGVLSFRSVDAGSTTYYVNTGVQILGITVHDP